MPKKKNEVVKAEILDFIQKRGLELRQKYSLSDLRLEEKPVRLVLISSKDIPGEELKSYGFPTEVVKPTAVVMAKSMEPVKAEQKEEETFYRAFSEEQANSMGIKEPIGPHTAPRDSDAVIAWKKRNKIG